MTRLEALTALKEATEAGHWDQRAAWPVFGIGRVFGIGLTGKAERAFNGSLDAARVLHEAVLQRCMWQRQPNGVFNIFNSDADEIGYGCAEDPARAWLLAILSTLIAMETDREA